jgi:hypothetical protein
MMFREITAVCSKYKTKPQICICGDYAEVERESTPSFSAWKCNNKIKVINFSYI